MPHSPAELNALHADFWAREKALMDLRMRADATTELAVKRIQRDERHHLPLGRRVTFETALERAERRRNQNPRRSSIPAASEVLQIAEKYLLARLARKGGKARKLDALSRLIRDIVKTRPDTSEAELLNTLRARAGNDGVIVEIDDERRTISYEDRGHLREVPLTALKDRLSRAKKELGL